MPARLRSLELHGYKTFATRTEFQFSPTVTAIVGPNGSGKSNIADAVRWVLGEQSYSLLRGKKTEDMIFAGSEQRSRAGMASATIQFDNSDNWLPIDFSEVAVTRRAYRDGENEYLLNRQRVRLRDVSELLAKSGLSERTYTIIGQGLVDVALALKAEERRRLFEEAAGIGLYRSRREEALRRLDSTRRNLERVEDILAELTPRLRSLERQARRAQEYEQIKADLRILLREWYGFHWHRIQRDLTEAREAARIQESNLEKIRHYQSEVDRILEDYRNQLNDRRSQLNECHRRLSELHAQREKVNLSLAVADEREKSLFSQSVEIENELLRLNGELESLKVLDLNLQSDIQQLTIELNEARDQARQAVDTLLRHQAERTEVEKMALSARQRVASLSSSRENLSRRLEEEQKKIENIDSNIRSIQYSIETKLEELEQVKTDITQIKAQKSDLEAILKQQKILLDENNLKITKLDNLRKEIQGELDSTQSKISSMNARLEVLQQAEDAYNGYAEGARIILQNIKQTKSGLSPKALGNYLEVPESLENAIAAALGEYLDAVIIDDDVNIEALLDVLIGKSARGVLLSGLNTELSLPVRSDQPTHPGVKPIGIASELIHVQSKVKPFIDLLLGQTWIVENRIDAKKLLASFDPADHRFIRAVTLQGEVFHLTGEITIGAISKASLTYKRQRKDLLTQIEGLINVKGAGEKEVNRINNEIDGLSEERKQMTESSLVIEDDFQKINRSLNEAEGRINRLHQEIEWYQSQLKNMELAKEEASDNILKIGIDHNLVIEELNHTQRNSDALSMKLESLSLTDYQNLVVHWNTQTALLEHLIADKSDRLHEQQEQIVKTTEFQSNLTSRKNNIKFEIDQLSEIRLASVNQNDLLNYEITGLNTTILPLEEKVAELEEKQANIRSNDSEVRHSLSVSEHNYSQAKIGVARCQESFNTLMRRIEDDIGLVAFEYEDEVSGPTPLPLEGWVEKLPGVIELSPELEEQIARQKGLLRRMGPINPEAQSEYTEVKERFEFLTTQVNDLQKAEQDIKEVIIELDVLMEHEFRKTFDAVSREFRQIFVRLFGGGNAHLILTDAEDLTSTGIEIEARLPGRREQGLSLLSGGERSLTATALVFALLRVSPTPFCILDEVDAMLDEANVGRFRDLLIDLSQETQFIIITHNRNTVQVADVIYGVTMGRDSTSQVISLRLDQVDEIYST